jgi:hypothetical protein
MGVPILPQYFVWLMILIYPLHIQQQQQEQHMRAASLLSSFINVILFFINVSPFNISYYSYYISMIYLYYMLEELVLSIIFLHKIKIFFMTFF